MTHEEQAKQAFIDKGFWPNEVMWACWRDAWLAGVAAERERCAKVSEEYPSDLHTRQDQLLANEIAAAIRKGDAVTKERKPVPEFELIEKWEGE